MVTALSQGRYLGAIVPAFSRLLWPSELSFGRRRRVSSGPRTDIAAAGVGGAAVSGRSESVQSVQSYSRAVSCSEEQRGRSRWSHYRQQ